MHDVEYLDFAARFMHFVDNDVRRFDELACSRIAAGSSHVFEAWGSKFADALANASNHASGRHEDCP
jgi:hypothetical protein